MSLKNKISLLGAGFALSLISTGALAVPVLPTANCGLGAANNCLTFNDFTVYSLALLNFKTGNGDINSPPNDPFFVSSNGADINNAVVIATSPAGRRNNQDLAIAGSLDDAYNTPNGAASTNFIMNGTDPAPAFAGDNSAQAQAKIQGTATGTLPLWDIQTSALLSYLGGKEMVFYFNLNQTNSTNYIGQGQNMLATLDVIFTNTTTGAQTSFQLNGNDCGFGPGSCVPGIQARPQTAGVDDILAQTTDQWAYVHGQICVTDSGSVVGFGPCDGSIPNTNTVNQNLGDNIAAFALFSAGAQTALESGLYNIMSVDLRMAAVTNGYEQLFIAATDVGTTSVPEPSSIAITGAVLTLMGAGAAWRRRKSVKLAA